MGGAAWCWISMHTPWCARRAPSCLLGLAQATAAQRDELRGLVFARAKRSRGLTSNALDVGSRRF